MRNEVPRLHKATVIKNKLNPNEKYKKDMMCEAWKGLARVVGEEHWTAVFGVVCYSKKHYF
jgi:hypothetical protein